MRKRCKLVRHGIKEQMSHFEQILVGREASSGTKATLLAHKPQLTLQPHGPQFHTDARRLECKELIICGTLGRVLDKAAIT